MSNFIINNNTLQASDWVSLFHNYPRLKGNNTLEFTYTYAVHQFYIALPWLISGLILSIVLFLALVINYTCGRKSLERQYWLLPKRVLEQKFAGLTLKAECSTVLVIIMFLGISLTMISTVTIRESADDVIQLIQSSSTNFTDTANLATSSVKFLENQLVATVSGSSVASSISSTLQQVQSEIQSFATSLNGIVSTISSVANYAHRIVYWSYVAVWIIIGLEILSFYGFYYFLIRLQKNKGHVVQYLITVTALLLAWWAVALWIAFGSTVGDTCVALKQLDEYNANQTVPANVVSDNAFIQQGVVCPSLAGNIFNTVELLAQNLPVIDQLLNLNSSEAQLLNQLVPFLMNELETVTSCRILTSPVTTAYQLVCGTLSVSLVQGVANNMFGFACLCLGWIFAIFWLLFGHLEWHFFSYMRRLQQFANTSYASDDQSTDELKQNLALLRIGKK